MTDVQTKFQQSFPQLSAQFDFVLAPKTYMKIGGPAEVFVEVSELETMTAIVKFCAEENVSLTILGGASNIIVSSTGIKGVVVELTNETYENLHQTTSDNVNLIRAGAGSRMPLFVRKTVDEGLQGLEYFLGVPGKLGGAVYNNAHYLTDLIGKHISRVQVIDRQGNVKWLSHDECGFAYDYSNFQKTKDIIWEVEFALATGDKERSLQLIKEATLYRAKTQPLGEPSSGCYFQNTPNTEELRKTVPQFAERKEVPSAYLIDQAGLKGTKVGGVHVSEKHAAFFINDGTGTSDDVQKLAEIVKQRVFEKYGVQLKEEVFFVS